MFLETLSYFCSLATDEWLISLLKPDSDGIKCTKQEIKIIMDEINKRKLSIPK